MKNFFIDKLNVVQSHKIGFTVVEEEGKEKLEMDYLPEVGKFKTFKVDLVTDAVTESVLPLRLEGSYSTSITVRSDGVRVECYGNPSRIGRIDNLWGFSTFDDCMEVYNRILLRLGLPLFTKSTDYFFMSSREGQEPVKCYNGAVITHVDFTRNLAVGLGNERPFLKALSTQSVGRSVSPFLYPDENTVEWYGKNVQKNGSTYRYLKCYNKTSDLLRRQRKNTSGADYEDLRYYDDLIQFTLSNGVVREEHSFKREYLRRKLLCGWGMMKETDFFEELQVITNIRKRLEVSNMTYESIADQLINEQICKNRHSANATQTAYLSWLHGAYVDKSTSCFRKHKARLLLLGIDISQKLDITRSPLRLKSVEVIEVSDIEPPDWYKKPKFDIQLKPQSHLKLVA